ncbi:MAG: hypothetical protein ABSE42_21210 [Bryobacteraceae bacterium]|jgi:hypothetical protein
MRQAIHIFRKDARHCWPYIAGVTAITAVHAWQGSVELPDLRGNFGPDMSGVLLALLMVLAWWFAIGAAVHGESLIGDRQFWTTRPYSWKSLLAAKLLFVAAFLALPLLLSDCIILLASAYNPLELIPGLLWRQCWFAGFLVLPFALAALTRATRELALAGLVFYVVAIISITAVSSHFNRNEGVVILGRPGWISDIAPWLLAAAAFSLAVWQYARRRTIPIRVCAIALGGLAPLVIVVSLSSVAPTYPVAREDDPRYRNVTVQLAADAGDRRAQLMSIPVRFSGWPRGLMSYELMRVTATAPETGSQVWTRERPNPSMSTASDGRDLIWLSIDDPKMLTVQKVDLSLFLYLRLYERQGTAEVRPERGWARVPGFGAVRLVEGAQGGHVVWRTALKPGEMGWVYGLGDAKSELVADAYWPEAGGSLSPSPAWFAISPVHSYAGTYVVRRPRVTVVKSDEGIAAVRQPSPYPLVFTAKRLVAAFPRQLKIPGVRLTGDETK